MLHRLAILFAVLVFTLQAATAQDIPLTIDSSQSTIDISLTTSAGTASDTSTLSGTASIELLPPNEPFSTAQVKTLNVVLDDGFTLSFFGGIVSASTAPGSTSMEMTLAGAPGTVDGLNQFDQLLNEATFTGVVNVTDPLGIAGGTRSIDLSSFEPAAFDMLGVQLSVSGTTLTVATDIALAIPLDTNITLDVTGTLVSTGELPIPDIQVVPDSLDVIRGVLAAGTVADLADSDNVDVSVRRDPNSIQAVTDLEIKGVSSIGNPGIVGVHVGSVRVCTNRGRPDDSPFQLRHRRLGTSRFTTGKPIFRFGYERGSRRPALAVCAAGLRLRGSQNNLPVHQPASGIFGQHRSDDLDNRKLVSDRHEVGLFARLAGKRLRGAD